MPTPHFIDSNTTLLSSQTTLPIEPKWFTPDYWKDKATLMDTNQGRGAVWFINSEFGNFVMRRYRRGGLIAKYNKESFLFTGEKNTRPWQELSLLETMIELGLPVPQPIGSLYTKQHGFYQGYLLTKTICDACDLFGILIAGNSDFVDWRNTGRVIKQFHNHGIHHTDLNCHNIMVDKHKTVWVIDFDKCDLRTVDEQWTRGNIARLKRSLDKESKQHIHFNVSDSQWHDFLEGYRG